MVNEAPLLVAYNGYGKPFAFFAEPDDVWFLTDRHHPPTASVWLVGTSGFDVGV